MGKLILTPGVVFMSSHTGTSPLPQRMTEAGGQTTLRPFHQSLEIWLSLGCAPFLRLASLPLQALGHFSRFILALEGELEMHKRVKTNFPRGFSKN